MYIDGAVRLDGINRLSDQCPTAKTVSDKHPGDLQDYEYPAILLLPHDTIVEIHGSAGRRIEIQPVQVIVLILARDELGPGGRTADQVAEQIAIEVRAAFRMEAPPVVGMGARPASIFPNSTPSDVRLLRSSRIPDGEASFGLHAQGAIRLIYQFAVATPEGQADVALDLA